MSTRRQILEAALAAERVALWRDLDAALTHGADPLSNRVGDLVGRIRHTCEALGYCTEWSTVPVESLWWWRLVETIPDYGLFPVVSHWFDLLVAIGAETDPPFHPVTDEAVDAYGLSGDLLGAFSLGDES